MLECYSRCAWLPKQMYRPLGVKTVSIVQSSLGCLGCLDHHTIELRGANRLERVLAREQPAIAVQHVLATGDLPPLAQ